MQKKGIEFSFTWIFVLIVGAVILFIALFMASRLINREGSIYNTEVAAELGAVLNPLETGSESGKYYPLSFPAETSVSNACDAEGTFGEQALSVRVRSGVGREWQEPGLPYRVSNKFVFSDPALAGKVIHVIATPLMLPFKVGDALTLYTETYCLVAPPESFEDAIIGLGAAQMVDAPTRSACPAGSNSVCFGGFGCDIIVDPSSTPREGRMTKKGKTFLFTEGLFYAALVSDPVFYECQLTRIRKRTSELARLYAEKSSFLDARGCSTSLAPVLFMYQRDLLRSTVSFENILRDAEALDRSNERLVCKLF